MHGDPIMPIVLLVFGILLMIIEVAIIPGFGVAGVLGLILMGSGTLVVWTTYGAALGAGSLVLSVVLSILVVWLFLRSRAARRFIQEHQITGDSSDVPSLTHLVGRTGVVSKPLRPSGIVEIDGGPYDVVSEGEFIGQGASVVVIRISTNSLVVKKTQEGG
ncbi:MAG: NfeD family protein [Pseudomonadota bacterium]